MSVQRLFSGKQQWKLVKVAIEKLPKLSPSTVSAVLCFRTAAGQEVPQCLSLCLLASSPLSSP